MGIHSSSHLPILHWSNLLSPALTGGKQLFLAVRVGAKPQSEAHSLSVRVSLGLQWEKTGGRRKDGISWELTLPKYLLQYSPFHS